MRTMTRLRHVLLVFVFGCGVALASSAFAGQVKLAAGDYPLLIGVWEGEFVSKSSDGKVRYTTDTQLKIVENGSGQFWLRKSARKWDTTVEIKDGTVILRFGHAERPFVYEEEGDSATLSVKYRSEFARRYSGSRFIEDSLELTKEAAASP